VFITYPYSPAEAVIRQTGLDHERKQFIRINNVQDRKDSATMHSQFHVLEEHVRAVNTRRLQEALAAEQLRLARRNQPERHNRLFASLRAFTGTLLVRAGERMIGQPATQTRTA